MVEVTPNVAERFTGQRRVIWVDTASRELREAERARQRARSVRRWSVLCLVALAVPAGVFLFWNWLASLPQRRSWPRMAVMFGGCCILAAVSMLAAVVIFSGNLLIIGGLYIVSFLALLLQPLVLPEDASGIERLRTLWLTKFQRSEADLKAAHEKLRESCRREADARRVFEGIRRAAEAPLQRLLGADFRAMSGPEFEEFLAEVFQWLGYSVRHIGQTGDQGVDLIVSKAGVDIAIQAKCYCGSVSNAAVQEVFTGMRVHRCHRCAVITSSWFTNGAREAAGAVRCALVDGDEIHGLIRGGIAL